MTMSIGYGLLAFAASSSLVLANGGGEDKNKANPFQDKAPGGWSSKPGSGLKYDGGDAFNLSINNQLQVHWVYSNIENAADTASFTVRRARTNLSGNVFSKNISYRLLLDGVDSGAAGDGNIKDAWVHWDFMSSDEGRIGLRVGQAKVFHGLEATGGSTGLFFVEKSSTTRSFTDGRSRGAWIHGQHAEKKLRWDVGAQNGDVAASGAAGITDRGEEGANSDNEMTYVLAVNFDPMGDYFDGKTQENFKHGDFRTEDKKLMGTFGAGLMLGNGRAAGVDVESTSININTAWSVSSFQAFGEVFLRTDEADTTGGVEEDSMGFHVQGNYLLPRSGDSGIQWGIGLRFNMIDLDDTVTFLTGAQGLGATPGEATEISAVVDAFYHGHACKTQIDWTLQDIDADTGADATNHIIRIGFQLLF
jgi:hypothetical protein